MMQTGNMNSDNGSRNYLPAYPPAAASVLDTYDPRGDAAMVMMYTPLEPSQVKTSDRHQQQDINSQNPFAPQHYQQQQTHRDIPPNGGAVEQSPRRQRGTQQIKTGYGYDSAQPRG
jgi:hypothetical protein